MISDVIGRNYIVRRQGLLNLKVPFVVLRIVEFVRHSVQERRVEAGHGARQLAHGSSIGKAAAEGGVGVGDVGQSAIPTDRRNLAASCREGGNAR